MYIKVNFTRRKVIYLFFGTFPTELPRWNITPQPHSHPAMSLGGPKFFNRQNWHHQQLAASGLEVPGHWNKVWAYSRYSMLLQIRDIEADLQGRHGRSFG